MRILLYLFSFLILINSAYSENTYIKRQFSILNSPDTTAFYIVNDIILVGNKTTKPHIIARELTFKKQDTVLKSQLPEIIKKNEENLLNTSLFNFVTITPARTASPDSIHLNFLIDMKERWYTWPFPIFQIVERNFNVWLQNIEFNRINYGFFINRENFRGRMENLRLLFKAGYTENYGFAYKIPYLNYKQTMGLGFSCEYAKRNEIAYNTDTLNKLVYYKDTGNVVVEEFVGKISYSYRPKIHNTHTFNIKFNHIQIADTIAKNLNPDYLYNSDSYAEYFTLEYFFKSDHRDYKSYPLTGYYWDFEINKIGLPIYSSNIINTAYLYGNLRKYWQVNRRFYFASGLTFKISDNNQQPYYVQKCLGYGRNFVRGYEYYVVDGQHFVLLKNNLKFTLLPTKIYTLKFIPFEKFKNVHYAFYVNFFTDLGYVYANNSNNQLNNSLLIGFGVGIDYVTYYDCVFRMEYSINKFGENGVFLHFVAPI